MGKKPTSEREHLPCGLCGRAFPPRALTKHHCLPRQKGGGVDHVEMICSQCHGMVHATYTNETLAKIYPTIDLLRRAPELASYIKWVRKQPASRRTKNARRRKKL